MAKAAKKQGNPWAETGSRMAFEAGEKKTKPKKQGKLKTKRKLMAEKPGKPSSGPIKAMAKEVSMGAKIRNVPKTKMGTPTNKKKMPKMPRGSMTKKSRAGV